MKAFLYTLYLKSKLDFKSAEMLITYYMVPLLFFAVMGAVFTSTNPDAGKTLIASMTIFSISMGAFIGTPSGLIQYFENDMRKTFKCAGIPLKTIITTTFISGFINLSIVGVIIYFVSPIAFKADSVENLLIHIIGIGALLSSSLLIGITLGLYAKSSSKLTMISQLVFLPSMLLSGIMFPADMLPKPLEYLGYVLPASNAMQILTKESQDWYNYAILFGICVLSMILIALRLRKYRFEDS